MTDPASIVNRALDGIGSDVVIGELSEGTPQAQPALRAYGPAMRQLLRAAHWNFARKTAPLQLLADATGQTSGVGTLVVPPWIYEYAFPTDCVKGRFLPWNYSLPGPTVPLMTGLATAQPFGVQLVPAPYLIATDGNYPMQIGVPVSWSQVPAWDEVYGGGPAQRTVILSNVKNASFVYTALIIYPSQWDDLFTEALVQLLTSRLAMPLSKDKKFGLELQTRAIANAKDMIREARLVNGNESGFPQRADLSVDWMRIRSGGSAYGANGWGGSVGFGGVGAGGGGWYGGWDSCSFADGSVF